MRSLSKVLVPPQIVPAAAPQPPVRAPHQPQPRTPRDTQPDPRRAKAAPALWQNLAPRAPGSPAPKPLDPVETARAEADAIVDQARAEADRVRVRAQAQAVADGRQKARAQARLDVRRLTRQARSLVREARALREQALAQLSDDVVETAVTLAKAVLARKAEQGCEDLRQLALQLIAEARQPRRLQAHPADAPSLEGVGVPVEASAAIARGGLLLQAADGERDARLEARIARLEAVLKAGEPR